MKKTIINWSGGKDCMMALRLLKKIHPEKELTLLTRFVENQDLVSMHHLRRELIEMQAQSLGLELIKVFLPEMPCNATYNEIMGSTWEKLKNAGFEEAVFGDIFLEDIRLWQEKQLAQFEIKCTFPLWKLNTHELAKQFLDLGFKAVITVADGDYFGKDTPGKMFDKQFIEGLPDKVDPCGENGEFHTFVYDGPGFTRPVVFKTNESKQLIYPSPIEAGSVKKFWCIGLLPSK